jgi:hypothetical protein
MKISLQILKRYGKLPIRGWLVPSRSHPDINYRVSLFADGHFECECMFYLTKHKDCRHIQTVKASLNPKQLQMLTKRTKLPLESPKY